MSVKMAEVDLSPQMARTDELEGVGIVVVVAIVLVIDVAIVVVVTNAPVVVAGHVYPSHGHPLGQPDFNCYFKLLFFLISHLTRALADHTVIIVATN